MASSPPSPVSSDDHSATGEGMSRSRSHSESVVEDSWGKELPKLLACIHRAPLAQAALQISHSLHYNKALLHGSGFFCFLNNVSQKPKTDLHFKHHQLQLRKILFSSSGSSGVKIISVLLSQFFLLEIYFCPNSTILTANVCVVNIHYILELQDSSRKESTVILLILLHSKGRVEASG